MHGGKGSGAPHGNANAHKHGRYTAQSHARDQRARELIALVRGLLENGPI